MRRLYVDVRVLGEVVSVMVEKSKANKGPTTSPETRPHVIVLHHHNNIMVSRNLALRIMRLSRSLPTASRSLSTTSRPSQTIRNQRINTIRSASHVPHQTVRWLSSKSVADEKIEEITELFATAQDEFEIAMEETEKMSVYAEEDRKAAREELNKLQETYKSVLEGPDTTLADEVKQRVSHRIRELDAAVNAMEEMALHQD